MGELSFNAQDTRKLEMAVRVFKADGRQIAVVCEADLEQYGWGTNPLAAVEAYRQARSAEALSDGREPWDSVQIEVRSDEASGITPSRFCLHMELGLDTTRWQKAMRELGQYLIHLGNGGEKDDRFTGKMELFVDEKIEEPNG